MNYRLPNESEKWILVTINERKKKEEEEEEKKKKKYVLLNIN